MNSKFLTDVDFAVNRLMAECGELFDTPEHAWSFLMEETHESLEDESLLSVGDEVYWEDPDEGLSSGYYAVVEILSEDNQIFDDTIIKIKNEAGSHAEVFFHELS